MTTKLKEYKAYIIELEASIEAQQADLNCFWTGNRPEGCSLAQAILAQHGRKRLEEMSKKPKLLSVVPS